LSPESAGDGEEKIHHGDTEDTEFVEKTHHGDTEDTDLVEKIHHGDTERTEVASIFSVFSVSPW